MAAVAGRAEQAVGEGEVLGSITKHLPCQRKEPQQVRDMFLQSQQLPGLPQERLLQAGSCISLQAQH